MKYTTDRKGVQTMPNTREKLIDIVEYYADFLDWERKEDIVDRIMELPATDNNVGDKWIPVTERLPEEDGDYLVYCGEYDGICVLYYKKGKWRSKWKEVTHWMPLPEPPKG